MTKVTRLHNIDPVKRLGKEISARNRRLQAWHSSEKSKLVEQVGARSMTLERSSPKGTLLLGKAGTIESLC